MLPFTLGNASSFGIQSLKNKQYVVLKLAVSASQTRPYFWNSDLDSKPHDSAPCDILLSRDVFTEMRITVWCSLINISSCNFWVICKCWIFDICGLCSDFYWRSVNLDSTVSVGQTAADRVVVVMNVVWHLLQVWSLLKSLTRNTRLQKRYVMTQLQPALFFFILNSV